MILAVDPGASSGWAIADDEGRVIRWGYLRLDSKGSAMAMNATIPFYTLEAMIIEGPAPMGPQMGWRTMYGLGVARGRWEQEARRHGLDVIEVNPRTWQAACLGGRMKREQAIACYRERARAIVGATKPIPADEAAAICIADWYVTEQRRLRAAGGKR